MFRKKLFYVNAQNHTVCRIKSKSTSSVNNFEDCFLPLYNWKVLEFCKKAFHYFPEKLSHFNVSIAIHLMETKTSSNNSLITFIFRWRVSHVIYFLLKQRVCLLFNRKSRKLEIILFRSIKIIFTSCEKKKTAEREGYSGRI